MQLHKLRQLTLLASKATAQRRVVSILVCAIWMCVIIALLIESKVGVLAQSEDNCVSCHRQQKERVGQVVAIFQTSTHSRSGVGCDGCHGGDSSQSDKSKAHAGKFIARPDSLATLEMCGACHRQPLEFFKKSRHIAPRPNAGRLDCAECHGVHAIGAASESFRWPQFCAGCHGLEYLPQLTRPFQEMLTLADDLREGIHRLDAVGRARPEFVARRKEIRHMISELVHKTDASAGLDQIPRILEFGAALKQQITSTEKQK